MKNMLGAIKVIASVVAPLVLATMAKKHADEAEAELKDQERCLEMAKRLQHDKDDAAVKYHKKQVRFCKVLKWIWTIDIYCWLASAIMVPAVMVEKRVDILHDVMVKMIQGGAAC